jgi:hypothetical protein
MMKKTLKRFAEIKMQVQLADAKRVERMRTALFNDPMTLQYTQKS